MGLLLSRTIFDGVTVRCCGLKADAEGWVKCKVLFTVREGRWAGGLGMEAEKGLLWWRGELGKVVEEVNRAPGVVWRAGSVVGVGG